MGACCASGGREGAFDQKEDHLANAELQKDAAVAEKTAKPVSAAAPAAAPAPSKPQENPDDTKFKATAAQMRSHNDDTNVPSR